MAVGERAVVSAPVGHDSVSVPEGTLASDAWGEVGCWPGWVSPLADLLLNLLRERDGPTFSELENWAESLDHVDPDDCDRHLFVGEEVRAEATTPEVVKVRHWPVGSLEHSLDVLLGNVPPLLHDWLAISVDRCTTAVESGSTTVPKIEESVLKLASWLPASDPLGGLWGPVGPHIAEAGSLLGEKVSEEH